VSKSRDYWFFSALALVAGLYLWSKSRQGQGTIEVGIEMADVAGTRIVNAMTSRGYRNNNPGNLEWISDPARRWSGMISNDGRYAVFDSPQNGTRALGHQLLKYYGAGVRSIRDIISKWAPSTENNTSAYIAHVSSLLGVSADISLNVPQVLEQLASAIALHENGYLSSDYDWSWTRIA
jgi:hypothetical protein